MYQAIPINEKGRDSSLLRFRLSRIASPVVLLPITGFFFAVFWSIFFNFRSSTSTHCRVRNYLPSISAAIVYPPPVYVWRMCIALHAVPRFFSMLLYYSLNRRRRMHQVNKLALYQGVIAKVIAVLNTVELTGLVLLTNVSSQDNKTLHVFGFSSFVIASTFYMMGTCLFHSAMANETELQWKSLKWKKISCAVNFLSLLLAMYFYHRHNKYCERGVYTLFAAFEYIIVLSNMAFHYTAKYDLSDFCLKVEPDEDVKAS